MYRAVIIGDLVASKKIVNRNEVQEKMQRVLTNMNNPNRFDLLSNYTITIGDEFQAVLSEFDSVFSDIIYITERLYPVKIRFSIGIGTLDTPINREQAIGMDGPVFHAARKGVDKLKKTGNLFRLEMQAPTSEEVAFVRHDYLPLANCSLDLLSHDIKNWNKNRLEIFKYLLWNHPAKERYSVKFISERLNITEQAVYKSKKDGALETYVQMCKSIAEVLDRHVDTNTSDNS